MKLPRFAYKLSLMRREIEFLLIVSWILFFPEKTSYLYFLTSACGIGFFLFKDIFFMKNAATSPFSYCLLLFNLLFIVSILFSSYRLKSVLLVSDIFLVSLYFFLSYYDKSDERKYFYLILYSVSLFSSICFINSLSGFFGRINVFFENPILQGVVSGIGVIIALYLLLCRFRWPELLLLIVNIMGIYVSGSKAAFLGTGFMAVLLVLLKKKRLIPLILMLGILTFLIPNPIRNMFTFSLKHDPYAFNRLDIWKMSVAMASDHPWTGVGLDNFSEISKKYNFKQKRGPARYFKIPRSPHSDYLKVVVETGLPGLFMICFLLFFVLRRIFSSSLFDLNKILILYLLFQAFLFNILFQFFFLFIFLFLLKNLFEDKLNFLTFHRYHKLTYSVLLLIVLLFSYIFPYLSDLNIRESRKTGDYIKAFSFLNRSQAFNPLDPQVYQSKAILYLRYFRKTSDMDSFFFGIENVSRAQRLNPNNLSNYLLEFDFHQSVLDKKLKYTALQKEILNPLLEAERIAPLNPFIPLMRAQIHLEFGEKKPARDAALRALSIEPDFVSALFFLRDQFGYFQDTGAFNRRIREIGQIAIRHPYPVGSYLDNLFKIPRAGK